MEKVFQDVAADSSNKSIDWEKLIKRRDPLYVRLEDMRSPFFRDYTRILHSLAYRRLKHKTQVFFNIDNDHICTRMEHVAHVESVSSIIANQLGLNTELTRAISIGHDIGHAPFGHQGEKVLEKLVQKYIDKEATFWHEKNGLRFVDDIELLEDSQKRFNNLGLTYAVRDGIVSHCGEIDENGLIPRKEYIDLTLFSKPGQFQPITWEGCVVKVSDKIAYLGRDVEDAISLGFLGKREQMELLKVARKTDQKAMNTTTIIYSLIVDLCKNSNPDKGIMLSEPFLKMLKDVKDYNYKYIYTNKRFKPYKNYCELVITELFDYLYSLYPENRSAEKFWDYLDKMKSYHPKLIRSFEFFLAKLCDDKFIPDRREALTDIAFKCNNRKIYGMVSDNKMYAQIIIDFIAGMTDKFAISSFNELITFTS